MARQRSGERLPWDDVSFPVGEGGRSPTAEAGGDDVAKGDVKGWER